MTSNIAKILNSANAATRETPVTTLLKCLRAQMQEWTYNNRQEVNKCTTTLTPSFEHKLITNYVNSLWLTVSKNDIHISSFHKQLFLRSLCIVNELLCTTAAQNTDLATLH